MKQLIKFTSYFLIAVYGFVSCNKEKILPGKMNQPPVANAGRNQIIILPVDSVELMGSGMDADGFVVSYAWRKVSGPPPFNFVSHDANAKVRNMVRGIYEFELKVTDNNMLFATDRNFVFVLDSLNDPLISGCPGCWDY